MKNKKILFLTIIILLFITAISDVKAKDYALSEEFATGDVEAIPDYAYVFGSYLFIEDSSRSDLNLVLASRSAYADDMFMAFYGDYYPTYGFAENNAIYDRGNIICIDHIDGERIDDDCPGSGGGGGTTPSGESFDVRFFYLDANNHPVQIGGKKTIPSGGYLNVAAVPDTTNYQKPGYRIDGWFNVENTNDFSEEENVKFDFGQAVESNLNLIIRLVPLNYTITYDFNGGILDNGANQYPANTVNCDVTDQLVGNCTTYQEVPHKDGYIFKGWSVGESGKTDQVLVNANESLVDFLVPDVNGNNSVTLYACWEAQNYTIKYMLNGGTVLTGQLEGLYNVENHIDLTNSSNKPTRAGYTFAGWCATDSQDCTNFVTTTSGYHSTLTLYAKWNPISITVKYINGASSSTRACNYGDCTVNYNNPTKAGYDFLYWEGSDGNIYRKNDPIHTTNSSITLTAKFNEGNYYEIEYNLGDDEAFDAQPITMYQYNAEGTDINLPTPIKKGFNFSKWSIVNTSTGSGTINVDNNTLSVRTAGKIVLEPTYEEKSYSVYYKYYHNGTMTEPIEIDECNYLNCSAPSISEQYNGLSIKNWNGTDGRTYAQGSRIMEPVDGLVLTAVYGVESGHSIKFYDGNQQYSGYITTFSSDYAFHLPVPTKTGYRFEGWKTKGQTANTPNYGTFINVNTVNDDLELEAIWTPIKVTVRYDLNYAGAQNNNHTEECNLYDTNCLITYVPDAREGYEFLGWSLTNSTSQLLGVNSDLLGLFSNPTTVMLHAIWKTLDYPVIYDLDGGHFDEDELNSITYFVNLDNPDIHMKKPFKEGYTFKAWVPTNAVVDGNEDATISSAGNVKLTATWTPNALSVNFKVDGRVVHGQVSSECNYDGCTILTSDPTKPGYEFEYWKVEDTGYTYKKNDTIVGFAGTITLEAVFNDGNTLEIDYKLDDGSFGSYTPIRNYVVGVGTNLPIPTKDGYTFGGWIVLDARGRETNEIIYKIDSDKTTNISLKAKWTIEGYEVKTVSHLGTTVTSTNFGQPFTFPEAPTKPDVYHTFAGWKEAVDNGQTYQAGDSIVVNSPHTYVATWDLTTQFSIGYNLNGGNYGEHHPYYYALNSNNVIISEPEKDGYRFTGWSDVLEHATVDEDGILHITGNPGNIELEAHWYQTRYNIAYNYDGGTGTNPVAFDLDLNNSATINLQEPTKAGYRFDGWSISGANATVTGNTITVSVPQGGQQTDLIVTAKWIQNVFNITYDYDGGTATNAATITLDQQNNGTLQLNVPTKTGYEFVNWTVLSGTATVENNILTVTDASDIALKANYRQVVFNITYDYFGGTITGTNPTTYEADSFESVVITAPNKDYYQFAGWTTDNPNITVSTNGNLRIEGNPTDVKLTATYNPRQFNVTYVEKENNEVVTTYGSHTCTFGVACDIQVTSPTKADRDFKYWKSDVGTIYPAGSKIFALTDMELTAEWDSVHTYTITYNLRGGEFTGNVIRVYNHGDTVSLPTAEFVSKTGYVFTKWSETESCDADPVTQITEGTENKEFYACYNANNYAINYYTDDTFAEVYDNNSGEYAYGTSHTVPTYVSSDMDKVFIHWKGNNNRIYLPGETIVVTEAINLYPELYPVNHDEPPVTHSITYNFNGGNDPIGGSLVGRYTEGDTFELGTITRDGYTFAGWYDEEDNLVTSVAGKTSDLVLHATWTASTYTINFYVGSELVETKTLNAGEHYAKHHYLDAQSADATAINADTGEEAYYFASGWAYYGSNEVVFPYEYDFGELITSNPVVNLSAVIDPDE
ncbi:MAG: InlB B-repeat-containing protein, partial [Bacilli bacterium]|nr:InlB B-repeat-containing protein [Bacilli bacterium]